MKIFYTLFIAGTFLTAAEFTDYERGTITGVGFATAQKINIFNKQAKQENQEIQKKLCSKEILENKMILSFKIKQKEAAQEAIEECLKNLQSLK